MELKTALATASAFGLAFVPIAGHAAPARGAAPQEDASKLGGISPVLSFLIVIGLIAAVIFVAEDEDNAVSA